MENDVKRQEDWALGVGHIAINPETVGYVERQREWVGLTDKEIEDCLEMSIHGTCRAIEAKLKEKNLASEGSIQTSDTKPAESARAWVGLTDDERDEIREQAHYKFDDISNAIEAKLKEKNNG